QPASRGGRGGLRRAIHPCRRSGPTWSSSLVASPVRVTQATADICLGGEWTERAVERFRCCGSKYPGALRRRSLVPPRCLQNPGSTLQGYSEDWFVWCV